MDSLLALIQLEMAKGIHENVSEDLGKSLI